MKRQPTEPRSLASKSKPLATLTLRQTKAMIEIGLCTVSKNSSSKLRYTQLLRRSKIVMASRSELRTAVSATTPTTLQLKVDLNKLQIV